MHCWEPTDSFLPKLISIDSFLVEKGHDGGWLDVLNLLIQVPDAVVTDPIREPSKKSNVELYITWHNHDFDQSVFSSRLCPEEIRAWTLPIDAEEFGLLFLLHYLKTSLSFGINGIKLRIVFIFALVDWQFLSLVCFIDVWSRFQVVWVPLKVATVRESLARKEALERESHHKVVFLQREPIIVLILFPFCIGIHRQVLPLKQLHKSLATVQEGDVKDSNGENATKGRAKKLPALQVESWQLCFKDVGPCEKIHIWPNSSHLLPTFHICLIKNH